MSAELEVQYPTKPPVQAVTEIVRIVRGKTFAAEKQLLALAIYNVQGFIQNKVIGAPSEVPDVAFALPPDDEAQEYTEETGLDALQRFVPVNESPEVAEQIKALPPFVGPLLVNFLIKLLMQYVLKD